MRNQLVAAIVCIVVAVFAVRSWDKTAQSISAESVGGAAPIAASATPASSASPYSANWGREVRIRAGQHDQFFVTAAVNNRPASFLVDTGASYVALRDTDARAAGVYTNWADYTHPIRTANGETKAALVTIKEIEIDGLKVENVKAFVLQDDQLGMNLLGMSFLSRLESVEARGKELILRK